MRALGAGSAGHLRGCLTDLLLWAGAVSAADVAVVARGFDYFAASARGLVAAYALEEGAGTEATDALQLQVSASLATASRCHQSKQQSRW